MNGILCELSRLSWVGYQSNKFLLPWIFSLYSSQDRLLKQQSDHTVALIKTLKTASHRSLLSVLLSLLPLSPLLHLLCEPAKLTHISELHSLLSAWNILLPSLHVAPTCISLKTAQKVASSLKPSLTMPSKKGSHLSSPLFWFIFFVTFITI